MPKGIIENTDIELNVLSREHWNRATIADGKWLNSNTIQPLFNNDCILASAIHDTSADLYNRIKESSGYLQNEVDKINYEIDTINAGSDVIDVVGTYQQLLEYSGWTTENDVIKVLNDESEGHSGNQTYWRYVDHTLDSGTLYPDSANWVYLGDVTPYYSKTEIDAMSAYLYSYTTTASGNLFQKIDNTSAYLHGEIVDSSAYLHNEIVNSSSYLYNYTTDASANLQEEIERTSGNLHTEIVNTSAYIFNELVTSATNLHNEILTSAAEVHNELVTTSGNIINVITNVSGDIIDYVGVASGNLHQDIYNTSSYLYSYINTASGNLINYVDDTSAYLQEEMEITSGNIIQYVDSQTSGFANVYLGSGGGAYGPTYTPVNTLTFWTDGRVSTIYDGGSSTEDQGYLSPWELPEATSANFNKVLGWTPDGAKWVNGDVPDWIIRLSTMDGYLESTNPIYNEMIDGAGDAEEIWGEALIRFNTSGSYALCPAGVNLSLTQADQCVNLKDLPAGVYSIGFLFQATNPGDVRYLQIKGQSDKTASDIRLMHLQTSLKRAR